METKTGNVGKTSSIKLRDDGVYLVNGSGYRERIADPISVTALGVGLQDDVSYTVLKFGDRDGKLKTDVVRSALLTAAPRDFTARMADAGYIWPETSAHCGRLIRVLSAQNPSRRVAVTVVPGWHGDRYVLPDMIAAPEDDDWTCHFCRNDNVRLPDFVCCGDLNEWQRHVASRCEESSRLRLAAGASFAGPILRRANLESFGFYFVGESSKGKTLCLKVAGSAAGLNSASGPTSWDGTPAGFQQLALGHRDNVVLLDDTSAIEGDLKALRQFVKHVTFRLATGRGRTRAGNYERITGAVHSDMRHVLLACGEDILFEPGFKVRGEDVRLIHIPTDSSSLGDIFDGAGADDEVGATVADRDAYVSRLERATVNYQGLAFREFVQRLAADKSADRKVSTYMREFIAKAPLETTTSAFTRIRKRFAVIYAATSLANDYEVLPFENADSLADIRKCMVDALDLLVKRMKSSDVSNSTTAISDDKLVKDFRRRVASVRLLKIRKDKKGAKTQRKSQIDSADGFLKYNTSGKFRVLLKSDYLRKLYPEVSTRNRLVRVLLARKLLRRGRQKDAATHLIMITPYPKKIACYWLSLKEIGLEVRDLKAA
jgi:hypothetical protein